jgi:hypothetical protein
MPVHTFTENVCWCRCARLHVGFHLLVHADYGNWLFNSSKTCPIGKWNQWWKCMVASVYAKKPLVKSSASKVSVGWSRRTRSCYVQRSCVFRIRPSEFCENPSRVNTRLVLVSEFPQIIPRNITSCSNVNTACARPWSLAACYMFIFPKSSTSGGEILQVWNMMIRKVFWCEDVLHIYCH